MSRVEKGYFPLESADRVPRANVKPGPLIGLLVIVSFVAGSVFTFLLCSLVSESGNFHSEDLQHIIQLSKSIDWSRINETINGQKSREKRYAPVSNAGSCGDSIKLVGAKQDFFPLSKSSDYHLLNNLKIEDNFQLAKSTFGYINDTYIKVQRSGIYLIYSQLTFYMKNKLTVAYEIGKAKESGKPSASKSTGVKKSEWSSLGYCSQDKMDKASRGKQCPLFITVSLNAGDHIGVYVKRENVTIDFQHGKSFFGMSLLMST